MEDRNAYGVAWDCIRSAKEGVRKVKDLLIEPSTDHAEEAAELLRGVEVQLSCAAAVLKSTGLLADKEMRCAVEEVQQEVAVLARFFANADRLLTGWLGAVQSKRGGYTEQGRAVPLVLVSKLTVEG